MRFALAGAPLIMHPAERFRGNCSSRYALPQGLGELLLARVRSKITLLGWIGSQTDTFLGSRCLFTG